MNNINIERRIKKHIWGRKHTIFLPVQPGFENYLLKELKFLDLDDSATVYKGGIEILVTWEEFYKISLLTKIANRILLRVLNFKAVYINDFIKKLDNIFWYLYFKKGENYKLSISTKGSKLYHKGFIKDNFIKYMDNLGYIYDEKSDQTIYIKIDNDSVTISLDCSGTPLYRRGYKKYISKAPIRETIAAAILLEYWDKNLPIVDPMCGSGTFLIEAAINYHNIIPNRDHKFPFLNWNSHKKNMFNYIIENLSRKINFDNKIPILGYDIDKYAINNVEKNINNDLFSNIIVNNKDFFDIEPNYDKGFLVFNPPYNLRIKTEKYFFKKLETHIKKYYQNWDVAIILPKNISNFNSFKNVLNFKNGGIGVKLIFRKGVI